MLKTFYSEFKNKIFSKPTREDGYEFAKTSIKYGTYSLNQLEILSSGTFGESSFDIGIRDYVYEYGYTGGSIKQHFPSSESIFQNIIWDVTWDAASHSGSLIYHVHGIKHDEYRIFRSNTGIKTVIFCNAAYMNDQNTTIWLLKYGSNLPSKISEL